MDRQQILFFKSGRISTIIIALVTTLTLAVTMIPFTGNINVNAATGDGVPESAYDDDGGGGTSFTNNTVIFDTANLSIDTSTNRYFNLEFTPNSDKEKSAYTISVKDGLNNTIIPEGTNLQDFNGELFLKGGSNYIFTIMKDPLDTTTTRMDFAYKSKKEPLGYVTTLSNGNKLISNYVESEYNDKESHATPINNFGANNRYIGNFGGYDASGGGTNADTDYYKIEIGKRAPLRINISAMYSGVVTNGFDVELYQKGSSVPIKKYTTGSTNILSTDILPAGTYYFKISSKESYQTWGLSYSFFVENQKSVGGTNSELYYDLYSGRLYTGNPISFVKQIRYNNEVLSENIDYTVSYSIGNTNVGKGQMIINGTGDDKNGGFVGTITFPYVIKPSTTITRTKVATKKASATKRKLTVKWKKVKGATHYQIKYRVKGAKKWKSKTVAGSKSSLTIKKLKKGKKYQYKVRSVQKLKGYKTYYGKYSKTKTSKKIK